MKAYLLLFAALVASACGKKENQEPPANTLPASTDYQKGEFFYDSTNQRDSAFFYFNNVTESSKDSLLVAMAYAYMAMIQNDAADYYGAQETAISGIRLLDDDNPQQLYCLSSLYNTLGRSNVGLREFDAAITHYKDALRTQPDEGYKNMYRNNIAVALREKGDYSGALREFLSIKPQPGETNTDLARRVTNLASLRWKAGQDFNPVPDLHNALQIRRQANDDLGITASYNHLSDYYSSINSDSAFFYATEMYAQAKKTNNTEDRLDALRKLTSLAPLAQSRILFELYEKLSDSIQTARSAAKNQFAVIRYESEKNRAENLLLLEDNSQKKLEILTQRILLAAIILVAVLIVAALIWRYKKKKKEDDRKSQALIKENQLRISQKIHDTVANGLYRIMSEMEHHEVINKEELLDRIEDMYERSRDISYDRADQTGDPGERMNNILTSFGTDKTKVSVVGNQPEIWQDVSAGVVKELEQVVQELAVNMKKHSGARHVVFHFSRSNERLHILYKDDGAGFKANFEKGNGLRSTENRIIKIGGETIFTSDNAPGAEIKIIVPIHLK